MTTFARRIACLCALAIAGSAWAEYPDKTITFVVPFAAGSATEQLLYEVTDPHGYLAPDVTADFS